MTIFKYIRDNSNFGKIKGKLTLRVVNVSETFEGIGARGEVNKSAFRKLADDLESHNDGISLS